MKKEFGMNKPVFLFTGQGSQYAGMGKDVFEGFEEAKEVLKVLEETLGKDLVELMFNGPEEELALTVNTQPSVLAVDIAIYRCLKISPAAAAGHSLGEYAGLVAAGSLTLEEAFRLVRERARAMQDAVPVGKGGMVVLRKVSLEEAREIAASATRGILELANINCPGQYVLSGETEALEEIVEKVGQRKALKLPVSVPFHSSMLKEAGEEFARKLDEVEFKDLEFPLVTNAEARPIRKGEEARESLKKQFASPVLWEQSISWFLENGHTAFIECGPKPILIRMVQAVARAKEIPVQVYGVADSGDIEETRAEFA